jgi:hypothetical protein
MDERAEMKATRYRDLNLLHPDLRPMVNGFLARTVEARLPVVIVETWRSQAAHEEDVANGRSWVSVSKHQARIVVAERFESPHSSLQIPAALAIDVALYEVYKLHGPDKLMWEWDAGWQKLGDIGERLGLKWGGRWERRDLGHFQAPWA